MCTIDTRDQVSIDTSDRHLDRPAIDPRLTLDRHLGQLLVNPPSVLHLVDISVDRLSIFIYTLSSGDRY